MMDERLAVRIGLRLRPLQRCGLLRWALRSGAALALALPLLLLAPARLARLASPLHTFPLPTTGAVAGLAVDPVLDRVFVAGADGSVWTLDGAGRRLLGAQAGGEPLGITGTMGVDALRHRLYVATMAGGVETLDGRTGALDAPLPFAAVTGLAVDAAANRLLLSQPARRALTVLDAETGRVLATLAGAWVPGALAVDQALRRLYVADVGTAGLVMLDADTFAALTTVALGFSPAAIAVEPGTHRVYVADPPGARVTVLAGATRTDISVGHASSALAVNSATAHLFVANTDDDTVSVVDILRDVVVATFPAGRSPVAIAANPRTGRVYVADSTDQTVSVLEHDGQPLLPLLALASRRR